MYKIYLITDNTNGKVYIGQTKHDVEVRFLGHLRAAAESVVNQTNNRFHRAIQAHGAENFTYTILEDNLTEFEVDAREIYWIAKYRSNDKEFGYNSTSGGSGVKNYRHTEETKLKIGQSVKKVMYKINTPERNKKIGDAQRGRKFTPEHCQHIKEGCAGKRFGKDNPFYGHKHTDETNKKISDKNTVHAVVQFDRYTNERLQTFKNCNHAAQWCKDNGFATSLLGTCATRIGFVCKDKVNTERVAYGFKWKFLEECND